MSDDEEQVLVPPTLKQTLERLSVHELDARIRDLEAEISLCRAEIDRKKASKAAADAVFKS